MRAAECFRYADAHGMLFFHFIVDLITLYNNCSESGAFTWSDEERGRLARLISLDFRMKNRTVNLTFAIALFFVCGRANDVNGMGLTTTPGHDFDYTDNRSSVELKKKTMLSVADSVGNYWFSDDTDLQQRAPHAYWLMNRMMQMMPLIADADDAWAWMLAMNESVDIYNHRIGRKMGSVNEAIDDMGDLINVYNAGNQPLLNTASYVESILAHYKAVYAYYRLIESIGEEELSWCYYREFCAWFDLNNAVNGIMYFYSYISAGYSALPMDLNGTFEVWSAKRLEELNVEYNILWAYQWDQYNCECRRVSVRKFDRLLYYFKTRTKEDVIAEFLATYDKVEAEDYEYAEWRVGRKYDFDIIASMLSYYERALTNWRNTREHITQLLPKEKQKSYREITKQIHTRLYYDLLDLKEIRY